jgi:hypothetical protein
MVVHPSHASSLDTLIDATLARLAPRPQSVEETGLSQTFLCDLLSKHLLDGGTLTMAQLVERMRLPGKVLESIMHFLRQEALVEVLSTPGDTGTTLRYRLTDRGRTGALDATWRSGYVGAAPVPLRRYADVVRRQTVHDRAITRSEMQGAFSDVVIDERLLDQLGPSLNSGRAVFIYGPAGTGKTYVVRKMTRLFRDRTLIPRAIEVNGAVIEIFDPVLHRALDEDSTRSAGALSLDHGFDPRFVLCERPVVVAGGELASEMLEIQYDSATRQYIAPLQLKANNGMFLIDDMGRQKVEPEAIFNRWIVPMEEKVDYLSMGSGRHFTVPFDVVLIFSTNIDPRDLADEAFLRRIGYKIEFRYLTKDQYGRIWTDVCRELGVVFDRELLDFVLTELHEKQSVRLLPCHPRDLLAIAVDLASYLGEPNRLSQKHLRWAWRNYFVNLGQGDRHGGHLSTTATERTT